MPTTEPIVKRRKKSLLSALSEPGDGARRQMDDLLIQLWQERFQAQDEHIAELTRTVRGFNGTPGVMERLGKIETVQTGQSEILNEIHKLLTTIPPAVESEEKKGLTKNQLAMIALKFLQPVATAVLIWALLTFIPSLMVHLGGP
jgi:hypothetical protein